MNSCSVTNHFEKFSSIKFAGEHYGSYNSRGKRSCFVMAKWCGLDGNIDVAGLDLRPELYVIICVKTL